MTSRDNVNIFTDCEVCWQQAARPLWFPHSLTWLGLSPSVPHKSLAYLVFRPVFLMSTLRASLKTEELGFVKSAVGQVTPCWCLNSFCHDYFQDREAADNDCYGGKFLEVKDIMFDEWYRYVSS